MNLIIKCVVLLITLYESCTYVSRNMAFLCFCMCVTLHLYKSMFRPEVIRRVELCFLRPCAKLPSLPRTSEIQKPCAGGEPDCNCCCSLSNKYTYMQLRSPEVTRVIFHLSGLKT